MTINTSNLLSASEFFKKQRFKYTPLVKAVKKVENVLVDTGSDARMRLVLGKEGTGKSSLIDILKYKYPDVESPKFNIPMPQVLTIEAEINATPKGLFKQILLNLGIKPKGDRTDLFFQATTVLNSSPVRLIAVDECQHVVRHTQSAVGTQKIADTLKSLMNKTDIAIIMVGQPDTLRLITNNKSGSKRVNAEMLQVARRNYKPVELTPAPYHDPQILDEMLLGYTNIFDKVNEKYRVSIINLQTSYMRDVMWAASKGHIGYMNDILREAIKIRGQGQIQLTHLAQAFDELAWQSTLGSNPFRLSEAKLRTFISKLNVPDSGKV
jgi:hypothetical protein